METFTAVAKEQLIADGRIYFRAPNSDVEKFLDAMAEKKHLPEKHTMGLESWDARNLLPSTWLFDRLNGHLENAKEHGLKFMIMDLHQHERFMKVPASHMPTLLRKSYLYGAEVNRRPGSIDRPLMPYEHLGALGIPVLLETGHPFSNILPAELAYKKIFSKRCVLSDTALKSMAGNGMH
eukprot:9717535-Alexandrium_andersonii.AAC.1